MGGLHGVQEGEASCRDDPKLMMLSMSSLCSCSVCFRKRYFPWWGVTGGVLFHWC